MSVLLREIACDFMSILLREIACGLMGVIVERDCFVLCDHIRPLFEALSESEVTEVAGGLIEEAYHAGEFIIKEGDPGESMYLLKSGESSSHKQCGRGASDCLW